MLERTNDYYFIVSFRMVSKGWRRKEKVLCLRDQGEIFVVRHKLANGREVDINEHPTYAAAWAEAKRLGLMSRVAVQE